MDDFPTVYWAAWAADATFFPGSELPAESQGLLWAVLTIVFYGDKLALADIEGRGLCIPSGKIEPGESIDSAAEREAHEETGAILAADRRRLIGCYRLISISDPATPSALDAAPKERQAAGRTRYCPVFVAEALGFEAVPAGSESRGVLFAAIEEVAELYYTWDPLMAAVFEYADEQRQALFPQGTSLKSFTVVEEL